MERLLIFIPAYNCEKQVPRVLSQLLDPHVLPWVGECIVVNNRLHRWHRGRRAGLDGPPPGGPREPFAQR